VQTERLFDLHALHSRHTCSHVALFSWRVQLVPTIFETNLEGFVALLAQHGFRLIPSSSPSGNRVELQHWSYDAAALFYSSVGMPTPVPPWPQPSLWAGLPALGSSLAINPPSLGGTHALPAQLSAGLGALQSLPSALASGLGSGLGAGPPLGGALGAGGGLGGAASLGALGVSAPLGGGNGIGEAVGLGAAAGGLGAAGALNVATALGSGYGELGSCLGGGGGASAEQQQQSVDRLLSELRGVEGLVRQTEELLEQHRRTCATWLRNLGAEIIRRNACLSLLTADELYVQPERALHLVMCSQYSPEPPPPVQSALPPESQQHAVASNTESPSHSASADDEQGSNAGSSSSAEPRSLSSDP